MSVIKNTAVKDASGIIAVWAMMNLFLWTKHLISYKGDNQCYSMTKKRNN